MEAKIEKLEKEILKLKRKIKKLELSKKILASINSQWDRALYELQVINKINKIMLSTLNLEELINKLLSLLDEMIEACLSSILILKSTSLAEAYIFINAKQIYVSQLRSFLNIIEEKFNLQKEKVKKHFLKKTKIIRDDNTTEALKLNSIILEELLSAEQVIGSVIVARTQVNPFTEEDKKLLKILANTSSTGIESALLYKKIEELTIKDSLTGLYNRRYFNEYLEKEINRAKRYKTFFSLVVADIDNFKDINDTYGHLVGDKVLISIANILSDGISRASDIACRWGGEEFVLLLSNTFKNDAFVACQRIKANIERKVHIEAKLDKKVTMSFGVASYPVDAEDKKELIEKCDEALYRAKRTGKNTVILA